MHARGDRTLLFLVLIMVTAGFVILASASIAQSQARFGESFYYLRHQLIFGGLIGSLVFLILQRVSFTVWSRVATPLFILGLVMLALVFSPLGRSFGGAARWLAIGPLLFQPIEFVKIGFVIYFAAWLSRKGRAVDDFSTAVVPFLIFCTLIAGELILQPDIGSLIVILGTATVLFFLAGSRLSHLVAVGLLGVVVLLFLVASAPYRLERLLSFVKRSHDPLGSSYQINQAEIAIGSGGIFGRGFNQSVQKYLYLPESMTDSIFAVYLEEFGLVGGAGLVALFTLFTARALRIARRATDSFGHALAAGLGIMIIIQVFVNMAAITGLVPLTGIPLPFISYGSSSLISTLAASAIIFNISKSS